MKQLLIIMFVVLLSACAGQYSGDPRVAEIQKWSEGCAQMGQAIKTATMLGRAGTLTESEASVIDGVDSIYRPVCSGSPGPLGDVLEDAAVATAIDKFCPELVANEDALLTASQVVACVVRKQLIQQLAEVQ